MSLHLEIRKKLHHFTLESAIDTSEGITGLLGASGSGKSMTLKCIAGIETPDEGVIELDGVTLFDSEKKINLPPQKRRVGYLFQQYALYPHMTVRDNILCGLRGEKDAAAKRSKLREMMELLQIEQIADVKPKFISGGQAQRTALARILVNEPKALLLDEPFSALDSHLRLQMQIEMKRILASYSGDVVMVTHSREEAYHMCDAIAVAEEGKFHGAVETKALFANPGTFTAARVTGCKNIVGAQKAGEHLVAIPDWNVTFETAEEVRDGLKGVAFRAHYLNTKTTANRFPVHYAGELEQPFEWVLLYRYEGMGEDVEPLWWRLPKDRRPAEFPSHLGLAPVNVLLLYD